MSLLFSLFLSLTLNASDHIDGPITTEHTASDITDFFTFPKDDSLVLVMNVSPAASKDAHFEDRLIYTFIVRSAEVLGASTTTDPSSELRIHCRFAHAHSPSGTVNCKSENNQVKISGLVKQVVSKNGIQLYSGLRSDPFIFNGSFAKGVVKKGVLPRKGSGNDIDKLNVLSIVLSLPKSILPSSDLLATATEVSFQEKGSTSAPELLDRVGRPEITNVTMDAKGSEEDLRDEYNQKPTFGMTDAEKEIYAGRITANIIAYDQLDGNSNWTESQAKAAGKLLVEDYLLVSLTQACEKNSNFLSIEKSILRGGSPANCGGRFLENDIMDDIYTWYITKNTSPIEDGADKMYRDATEDFPFLAEPDTSFSARAKAWIARKFLL